VPGRAQARELLGNQQRQRTVPDQVTGLVPGDDEQEDHRHELVLA
jgi:hypothetical protein